MDNVRTITIDLVRHAPTIYDKGTLPPYDGDADISNINRITALANALPKDAAWWVSPLIRCKKTAQALQSAGASHKSNQILQDIEEQRYGSWHGLTVAEIWEHIKDEPKSNWHFLHPSTRPPHGESFNDLITRLTPVYDAIMSSQESHLVIIAHGMVIRALVGMALSFDHEQSLAMDIDNLSRTTLTYMAEGHISPNQSGENSTGGRWKLNRLNQMY